MYATMPKRNMGTKHRPKSIFLLFLKNTIPRIFSSATKSIILINVLHPLFYNYILFPYIKEILK
jgi:hypothetical protein